MNEKAIVPVDQAGAIQVRNQTEISFYDRIANPIEAVVTFGRFISESGICGKANQNMGNVIAWHCITKKINPIDFTREYHVLEDGKISKRADAMLAEFKRRGGKWKWLSDLGDDKKASAEITSSDGDKYTWSFTIEDAEGYMHGKYGIKDNWRNSTPDMLRARLISKTIRAIDPEVNAGVYTPEELKANVVEITPSQTGLFDRAPDAPADAPIQTTAEVVNPPPAAPKEAEQPTQQTMPLTAPSKSAAPKELSSKKKFDVVLAAFVATGIPATTIDKFFIQKKWLVPGQCLMDLSKENIDRAHKTIDQLIPLFKAWNKQQLELAAQAAKNAQEGASK